MDYSLLMFLGFLSIQVDHIDTTESVQFRIINGTEVTFRSQFPYQAAIVFKRTSRMFCGGAIIHKRFVLTAAHCCHTTEDVMIQASAICVEVGNIKIYNREEMEIFCKDVHSIIIHEKYNITMFYKYDIALLEISGGFGDWTDEVNLIYINEFPNFDESCIVSGFGRTESDVPSPPSSVLRYAEVSVLDRRKCKKEYSIWVPLTLICGRGHSSFCSGDSGGPLVCSDQLVGVVSGAENCSTEKMPNFYTDVSRFLDWIKLHIDDFDTITTDDDVAPPSFPPPILTGSSPAFSSSSSAERRNLSLFFLIIAIVPLLRIFDDMFI